MFCSCINFYSSQVNGLNVNGIKSLYAFIPCWEIKQCGVISSKQCDAFGSLNKPCWEASLKIK